MCWRRSQGPDSLRRMKPKSGRFPSKTAPNSIGSASKSPKRIGITKIRVCTTSSCGSNEIETKSPIDCSLLKSFDLRISRIEKEPTDKNQAYIAKETSINMQEICNLSLDGKAVKFLLSSFIPTRCDFAV